MASPENPWQLKPKDKVEYLRPGAHEGSVGIVVQVLPEREYLIQPDTMHITPLLPEVVPARMIVRVLSED